MKDHKKFYGLCIRSSMFVSLVITICVFIFVPTIEVKPYKGVVDVIDTLIVGNWTSTNRPIPPKPSERPPRPPVVVIPGEGGSDNITTIGQTIFDELNPAPITKIEPVKFHKVEIKPELRKTPSPEYPEILRNAGIEGYCVIWGIIDTTGKVTEAKVYHSAKNPLFNEAALTAFRNYEFKPGYQFNRPVPVEIVMPFRFRLK